VQNRLNSNVDRPLSQRRDKPGDEHWFGSSSVS